MPFLDHYGLLSPEVMKEPVRPHIDQPSYLVCADTEELEGDIINWQDVKKGVGWDEVLVENVRSRTISRTRFDVSGRILEVKRAVLVFSE